MDSVLQLKISMTSSPRSQASFPRLSFHSYNSGFKLLFCSDWLDDILLLNASNVPVLTTNYKCICWFKVINMYVPFSHMQSNKSVMSWRTISSTFLLLGSAYLWGYSFIYLFFIFEVTVLIITLRSLKDNQVDALLTHSL